MRKLKLESLQVESFATTERGAAPRGTVQAHADVAPDDTIIDPWTGGTTTIQPATWNASVCVDTYDVKACGDTRYFDCTFGCTIDCSRESYCHVCYADDNSAICEVK
ncbi:MAG TPA: hypothetical protein VNP72_00035 [Longimicrobium sp.]|nr:hypothetical protein [Longimicrobium sp.]